MAVSSTSGSTSSLAGSNGSLGNGTVIDVNSIVSKLDVVEQAPIDKVASVIDRNNVAISDLGTIKAKIAALQTDFQSFSDSSIYSNKLVSSSDSTVVDAAVSTGSAAIPGNYNINVTTLAASAFAGFGGLDSSNVEWGPRITDPAATQTAATLRSFLSVGVSSTNVITVGATGDEPGVSIDLAQFTSLNAIRDKINLSSTSVRAAVVDTGNGYSLTFTAMNGGALNDLFLKDSDGTTLAATVNSAGVDAKFTVNGQSFTRTSNTVLNAVPGLSLQLGKVGSSMLAVTSASAQNAQVVLSQIIDNYNSLINSYTSLSKFDPDPSKRGSLYGDSTLSSVIDSITNSLMSGFKDSANSAALLDKNGKAISLITLGLELQLDGTLQFNSATYNNSVSNGVFDLLASGFTSPTYTSINYAIGLSGMTGSLAINIDGIKSENNTLQSRVKDMETRKAEKMAKYRAQYSALDALLYQLQATNNSLTTTFNVLNNSKSN
jgi:flagellar hook-associated protein 2